MGLGLRVTWVPFRYEVMEAKRVVDGTRQRYGLTTRNVGVGPSSGSWTRPWPGVWTSLAPAVDWTHSAPDAPAPLHAPARRAALPGGRRGFLEGSGGLNALR